VAASVATDYSRGYEMSERKTYNNLKDMTTDLLMTKKAFYNPLPMLTHTLGGAGIGAVAGGLAGGTKALLNGRDAADGAARGMRIGGVLGGIGGFGHGYGYAKMTDPKRIAEMVKKNPGAVSKWLSRLGNNGKQTLQTLRP